MVHRAYKTTAEKSIYINDGKPYNGSNVFVVRSNPFPDRSMPTPALHNIMHNTKKKPAKSKKTKYSWLEPCDMKRRKRVIKYKFYDMEGKVKTCWRRGVRWINDKCHKFAYGF
ncbi:hypothetical protein DCAR_0933819 [Daucus carota subsp. sativus]|uniref:Uncharacterized protein n=1 Tax=Daucus carota subsp. sativus TaxID=79200 RepID=A0AAF1BCG7_DAUCS|nr:hypothetical protein DCAR_0933819 [Daucus carota subsp. sativus]